MKKWMVYVVMCTVTAGMVFAAEGQPWWKFGLGKKEVAEEQPAPPPREGLRSERPELYRERREQREKMEQFKAQREEIEKLAAAIRAEPDPVKKEELTGQLRAKLTEGAEKMNEIFRQRLQKAEAEIAKMKERLADAEQNKEKRIEEHLQRLLSGEKPPRPALPGGAPHKKGPPPPAE